LYVWSKDGYENYRQRLRKRLIELEMENERCDNIDKKIHKLTIRRDGLRKYRKKMVFSFLFSLAFFIITLVSAFALSDLFSAVLTAVSLFIACESIFELSKRVDELTRIEISLINIEIKSLVGNK
jgi:hypothetical protein